jgi:spore germination cell wall hydrolase CwlJ-like protein
MRKGAYKMDLSKISDLDVIAATICAEAGGEPFAGKVMVGEVIANRSINSGTSPRAVCLAPKQFSCWNNRGTMELRMQTMRKHPAWADCLKIAESICWPGYKPVSPVTHYYAFKKIAAPDWARRMEVVAVVGGHRFYKESV